MTSEFNRQTDSRLEALEVKASYTEDAVDRLNDVIVRQQQQIDQLLRELGVLRQEQASVPDGPQFRSLRDDLPPHY